MHLTDSQWTDIMKLVIDNIEREINIIKEAGSSWSEIGVMYATCQSEIEGIKKLGKTLISEIRQIPLESE
jgi:hypothetical protein